MARKVARVSAFAPVGFVADAEVLICVESFVEPLRRAGELAYELDPVALPLEEEVLVRAEPDRSFARVGSVADDEPLHCVESFVRLPELLAELSVRGIVLGYAAFGVALPGDALVPGGAPAGLVADDDVLCCVESFGRAAPAPPATVVLLEGVDALVRLLAMPALPPAPCVP